MKIYIDGLFYQCSGIGRYYESIMKELAKTGINIYTCVPHRLQSSFEEDFKTVKKNITPVFTNYEKFSPELFYKHSYVLKRLEKKVDIFLYPHINMPFYIPHKTIAVIHDLRFLTDFWDRGAIKKRLLLFLAKRAIKKSAKIVSISKITYNQITKNIKTKKDIRVIHEFIDDKFHKTTKNKPLINEKYILYIGNRRPHKNIENLIRAFNNIKNQIDHKLILAGEKDNSNNFKYLIKNLYLEKRVHEINTPKDDIVINLYQHADLFVFPSLFEGFGLPPLEAIACGCPSITSNIDILKEILGEEIACMNPYCIDDMAEKILKSLKNEKYRNKLLNSGKEKIKLYDKKIILNKYIECFTEVLQQ